MLHGFVTWATACVIGGALVAVAFLASIPAGIAAPELIDAIDRAGVHWGMFLSDAAAAIGATLAGALAVRVGERAPGEDAAAATAPRRRHA